MRPDPGPIRAGTPVRAALALAAALAVAVAAAAAAWPTAAAAHAIVTTEDDTLVYRSPDATSQNQLTVSQAGGRIELRDPTVDGGMDYGQCAPGAVDSAGFVREARCDSAGIRALRIELFDREDTAQVLVALPAAMSGGDGADRLTGGPADDMLDGGPGIDVLDGGDGDDELRSADGLADQVRCGAGVDVAAADTADSVDASCETVTRAAITPDRQPGAGDVTPPDLRVRASRRQRALRLKLRVRVSEAATVVVSGFVQARGGAALPVRSARRHATPGRFVTLTVTLRGRALASARRALDRNRRVTARLSVVATDPAGNSGRVSVRAIVLR